MTQTAKPRIREAFVTSAAEIFSEVGYEATTMVAVAQRAGSSVGNLYKYFEGKQQLFAAAIEPELARELLKRTRARMRAFGSAKDARELEAGARYHTIAGDLLDYCLQHRAAVVFLLLRAEGTAFASFKHDFVDHLVDGAFEYMHVAYPSIRPTPAFRFVLHHAYLSLASGVAEALRQFSDETSIRAAISLLTSQHQGGLKRLFETQGEISC